MVRPILLYHCFLAERISRTQTSVTLRCGGVAAAGSSRKSRPEQKRISCSP